MGAHRHLIMGRQEPSLDSHVLWYIGRCVKRSPISNKLRDMQFFIFQGAGDEIEVVFCKIQGETWDHAMRSQLDAKPFRQWRLSQKWRHTHAELPRPLHLDVIWRGLLLIIFPTFRFFFTRFYVRHYANL